VSRIPLKMINYSLKSQLDESRVAIFTLEFRLNQEQKKKLSLVPIHAMTKDPNTNQLKDMIDELVRELKAYER
jgi:hypothetical protein